MLEITSDVLLFFDIVGLLNKIKTEEEDKVKNLSYISDFSYDKIDDFSPLNMGNSEYNDKWLKFTEFDNL